jgi:hypothetical protein
MATNKPLPHDLRQATRAQIREMVDYLSQKPLKDLRRRQSLNEQQTKAAYEQGNDLALSNLHIMAEVLQAAVDKGEFHPNLPKRTFNGKRWVARRYGLTSAEADALIDSGRYDEIRDDVEHWRAKHGLEPDSPLARGYLLDLLRGERILNRNGRLPLDTIKVLFRQPDALALWGIPYDMRPSQSPKDLHAKYRKDWIFLGYPGWFGSLSQDDIREIKAFLAQHRGNIPENPYEWTRL